MDGGKCSNLFYFTLCDFGERNISLILYCFCICFVKTELAAVGGCQVFDVAVCYYCFLMNSRSWRVMREHILYCNIVFIDASFTATVTSRLVIVRLKKCSCFIEQSIELVQSR